MGALRRVAVALYGALALAVPALAQHAGAEEAPAGRDLGWLWLVAAVLVVVALLRLFFSRPGPHRGAPPARRP